MAGCTIERSEHSIALRARHAEATGYRSIPDGGWFWYPGGNVSPDNVSRLPIDADEDDMIEELQRELEVSLRRIIVESTFDLANVEFDVEADRLGRFAEAYGRHHGLIREDA